MSIEDDVLKDIRIDKMIAARKVAIEITAMFQKALTMLAELEREAPEVAAKIETVLDECVAEWKRRREQAKEN